MTATAHVAQPRSAVREAGILSSAIRITSIRTSRRGGCQAAASTWGFPPVTTATFCSKPSLGFGRSNDLARSTTTSSTISTACR